MRGRGTLCCCQGSMVQWFSGPQLQICHNPMHSMNVQWFQWPTVSDTRNPMHSMKVQWFQWPQLQLCINIMTHGYREYQYFQLAQRIEMRVWSIRLDQLELLSCISHLLSLCVAGWPFLLLVNNIIHAWRTYDTMATKSGCVMIWEVIMTVEVAGLKWSGRW